MYGLNILNSKINYSILSEYGVLLVDLKVVTRFTFLGFIKVYIGVEN